MEFKMDDREAMAWQMLQAFVVRLPPYPEGMVGQVTQAYQVTDAFIAETHARRNEGQR